MNMRAPRGAPGRRGLILGGLAALVTAHAPLQAQTAAFPSRPIQLLVAAPAGGPSDNLARMLAAREG